MLPLTLKPPKIFSIVNSIQARALMTGITEHYDYQMSDLGKVGLDELVKLARQKADQCCFPGIVKGNEPQDPYLAVGVLLIHELGQPQCQTLSLLSQPGDHRFPSLRRSRIPDSWSAIRP